MMESKVTVSKHRYVPKTFEICPTAYPYFTPEKVKKGSIGYDLVCPIDFHVPAHSRVAIPLNFAINLPFGVEAKIEARSGMTLRGMEGYGTRVKWGWKWGFIPWKKVESGKLNFDADIMPGKIDPNFTDSINVLMKNNDVAFTIKAGTRIAQMTFYSTIAPFFEVVTKLSCKSRGGGLGSSGSDAKSEPVRKLNISNGVMFGGMAHDGGASYEVYASTMRQMGMEPMPHPAWQAWKDAQKDGAIINTEESDQTQQPKPERKDKALRAEYRQYRHLVEDAGLLPMPYHLWLEDRNKGNQPEVKGVSFDEWFGSLTPEKQEEVRESPLYKVMRGNKDAEHQTENM